MTINVLPVAKGWNVWEVAQLRSLPFSLLMLGVSRDDQLKVFVEDSVRLGNGDIQVADPHALKGSMVQIVDGAPVDLPVTARKEDLGGEKLPVLNGPTELRYVRFFNRGEAGSIPWPRDDSHIVNTVYGQSSESPLTSGNGPPTLAESALTGPLKEIVSDTWPYVALGALALFLVRRK